MPATEQILEKVLQSENLPTLPTVASELLRLMSREDTQIGEIASLITNDLSLSAKVLKVVNSAYYNFPSQISTIQQAVSILGINAVRSLVLSFSFLNIRKGNMADPFDYERFWERSLSTAVAARMLATPVDGIDADEAFTAGLLQNIGVLLLARTLPDEFAKLTAQNAQHDGEIASLENELLGAPHMEVGYAVAKAWGFPPVLLAPIRYHHQPENCPTGDVRLGKYCQLAYLADLLVTVFYAETPEKFHQEFRQKAASRLRLSDSAIARIVEQVDTEIKKTGRFLGVSLRELRPIEEILQEANARLSLLNMSYEQKNRELIAAKVKLQQLTKELEEKNRRLETLANVDGLTEIYNHRYFQETLAREMSRAIRYEKPLSLVLADIDHFKNFNDRFGHQTGDFILKETCRVLGEMLRQYDTLARYGGEEFAIILPETGREEAEIVAEKLRTAVDGARFEEGPESYSVTMSCGVACMEPGEKMSSSELIERVDKGLYSAKKKGRNQVVCFVPKKGWFAKG